MVDVLRGNSCTKFIQVARSIVRDSVVRQWSCLAIKQERIARDREPFTESASDGGDDFHAAEDELRLRRVESALELYLRAELSGFDADSCAAGRWTCHMLLGDFQTAWKESEAIANRGNPDPNRFWNGKSLAGQDVILRCLHGLGDTIQFLRYTPMIKQIARSLTIEAQPALKKLVENCGLADNVITWGEPEPRWSQQVEIMELPRIFRTTLDSIPGDVPYIRLSSVKNGVKRPPLQVGLVWASSRFNPARSILLEILSQVCGLESCEFLSFQGAPDDDDLAQCPAPIRVAYEQKDCLISAAKALLEIDLLITVDTMMAHLAGALGVRVWTLLPYEADWRWMLERRDSPWYPTMRLFRQMEQGEWKPVIDQVRTELRRLVVDRAK